jgi:hypothetical protein
VLLLLELFNRTTDFGLQYITKCYTGLGTCGRLLWLCSEPSGSLNGGESLDQLNDY